MNLDNDGFVDNNLEVDRQYEENRIPADVQQGYDRGDKGLLKKPREGTNVNAQPQGFLQGSSPGKQEAFNVANYLPNIPNTSVPSSNPRTGTLREECLNAINLLAENEGKSNADSDNQLKIAKLVFETEQSKIRMYKLQNNIAADAYDSLGANNF